MPPAVPSVTGQYTATQFSAGATDVLALGGTLSITLDATGQTTGRLVLPEELADGDATEFSLAGTYRLDGDEVTFTQDADTFVRDATWTLSSRTLRGTFRDVVVVMTAP